MKKTIQKTVLILFLMALSYHIKAQSGQIVGTSSATGDLYQAEKDLGVGSVNDPNARVHIFNGISRESMADNLYYGYRPFLISGEKSSITMINYAPGPPYAHPPIPVYSFPKTENYFTVDQHGYTGVGILNPFSKLNVHEGIITISEGEINEPTRWEIYGTKSSFAVKDYNAERYRFWINKEDGYVGIGTESPDELLEVENGNLQVNNGNVKIIDGNLEIKDGLVVNFKVGTNGAVRARRIDVDLQTIPDYVFRADYKLMPLEDLKKFIEEKKHLPNIKSEQEYNNTGSIDITELNLKLLEKVEELTLYVIDLQEQLKAQQAQLNLLK